ncbi:MAG: XdhC family protein [Actinomycetia bacterium]|nr:XdhC family protein [Actinomycetes bacterium]
MAVISGGTSSGTIGGGCMELGLMTSKSKKEKLFKDLAEAVISESFLDSVHSPVGLPIGNRTPDEIAVSITVELIALLHEKTECIITCT